jgi:hypothetical protein
VLDKRADARIWVDAGQAEGVVELLVSGREACL